MRDYKHYCDNIENVENYDKALADNFVGWECHHRLETHTPEGERRLVDVKAEELIASNMYFHRPANELIFLTTKEHRSLNKGKPKSEEMKTKLSKAKKGKPKSEEHKKKIAESLKGHTPWNKGVPMDDEQKQTISIKTKELWENEEYREKQSLAHKDKHRTEEWKKDMSDLMKELHWYNNGEVNVRAKECPPGFKPGRLSFKKRLNH